MPSPLHCLSQPHRGQGFHCKSYTLKAPATSAAHFRHSDDLQLGQDQVGAEGKGGEESCEAEVADDHEGRELTWQVACTPHASQATTVTNSSKLSFTLAALKL